jgi:hypothetical protein
MTIEEQVGILSHMWRIAGFLQKRSQTTDFMQLFVVEETDTQDVRDAKLKFHKLKHRYREGCGWLKGMPEEGYMRPGNVILPFIDCTRRELNVAIKLWLMGEWNLRYENPDGTITYLMSVSGGRKIWSNGAPIVSPLSEKRLYGKRPSREA